MESSQHHIFSVRLIFFCSVIVVSTRVHGETPPCFRMSPINPVCLKHPKNPISWCYFTAPLLCDTGEQMRERWGRHFYTSPVSFHSLSFDSCCSSAEDMKCKDSIEWLLEVSLGMRLMETSSSRAYLLTCSMARLRG